MSTLRTRTLALVAAGAVLAGPVLFASTADAHERSHKRNCTISAQDRAAAKDRLQVLNRQLAGHKLTEAEKSALKSAVQEMYTAARDAKMSTPVREAEKAELKKLAADLEAATSPEVRDAIRAEMDAISLELRAAKLTKAEKRELHAKAEAMVAALRAKPTKAQKAEIRAEAKLIVDKLRCATA